MSQLWIAVRKLCTFSLVLIELGGTAAAQGFDADYAVRLGDLNSDGQIDIYLDRVPEIVFVSIGDILAPIVVSRREVGQFVLQNQGQGEFVAQAISPSQVTMVSQWPVAPVEFDIRDHNFDGHPDLQLNELGNSVTNALDQIVFASSTDGGQPTEVTALTNDVQNFVSDTFAWMLDPSYFDTYAPWVVQGAEPPSALRYATVFDSGNVFLINHFRTLCENESSSTVCGVSSTDPSVCVVTDDLYDADGNVIGSGTVDVCVADTHIYAYDQGSVTLSQDYSVFHDDAVDFADQIESVAPNGIWDMLGIYDPVLNDILRDILRGVFGNGSMGDAPIEDEGDSNFFVNICQDLADNSINHPSFPFDEVFDPSDPTYHHYDVNTNVCTAGQSQCSVSTFQSDVLPLFSYPSYKLKAAPARLGGWPPVMVHVAPPLLARFPSRYTIRFGNVIQQQLASGNWPGAIQNVTMPQHFVYPGTISRIVTSTSAGPNIFTHGIGHNLAATFNGPPGLRSQPINMMLACANDWWGPKAFKVLDKQAIKYWQANVASQPLMMLGSVPSGAEAIGGAQ